MKRSVSKKREKKRKNRVNAISNWLNWVSPYLFNTSCLLLNRDKKNKIFIEYILMN